VTLEAAAHLEGIRYDDHVALARGLVLVAGEEPGQIARHYCSVEWWGGSGSMADLDITDRQFRRRHTELLVALVKLCRDAGVECPRAERWNATFESWLRDGAI
jgi:hypothetical protein